MEGGHKIIHVLNGDCLATEFLKSTIQGEAVICRECLVEGPLRGESMEEFWKNRAAFIGQVYHESHGNYFERVVGEFKKIQNLNREDFIYLWFEYDLFCQVNYWFILSMFCFNNKFENVFLVAPLNVSASERWMGFGNANPQNLQNYLDAATLLTQHQIETGAQLWEAYRNQNVPVLDSLSQNNTSGFPLIKELNLPLQELFYTDGSYSRPVKRIADLKQTYPNDFQKVFEEFSSTEGAYGWGDSQVKRWFDQLP